MKIRYAVLFLVVVMTGCGDPAVPTTLILLRHAKKVSDGTDDPNLNAKGVERAKRLAEILKDTKIGGIYSTDFKRTRQTVQPLADVKNLEIDTYEPYQESELKDILHKHRGETVVVCGHSNNIPWTANLLTGKDEFKDYDESEYGIILIVSVVEKGSNSKVTRVNY
jgi:2,3-bisphosphoglycerate-dependent phosphoglycerate mutase